MAHVPPRSRGTLRAQADRSYVSRAIILPVQKYMSHRVNRRYRAARRHRVVALGWANSPWREEYHHILETHLHIDVTIFYVDLSIEEWINDGLMALFFFVIGLEIKREVLYGQLSTLRSAALPAIAAIGGMVVPASIYLLLNLGGDGVRGWGIPMATDIAFALGVLALLGRRIPMELRVFMLGLAVVDDLGAIAVIAVCVYGDDRLRTVGHDCRADCSHDRGQQAGTAPAGGYRRRLAFLIWVAVLNSGVHATVAGVLIAGTHAGKVHAQQGRVRERVGRASGRVSDCLWPPVTTSGQTRFWVRSRRSARLPRRRWNVWSGLSIPWSSYVILPLFALANAGIEFSGGTLVSRLYQAV